jgi:hypothetical protein
MSPAPRQPDLADAPLDDDDDRVLARVAALYEQIDPPPTGLVERIEFALTLDALHAEVAELQRTAEFTGVRSAEATEARTVTFASSGLTVMITITPASADSVRLDGWAAPGGEAAVELRTESQTLRTDADADGRFVFDQVPRGMARLLLTPSDSTALSPVVTPSIEL